ncbi:PREDICTED: transmembrane protease serine 9-like [Vollenhovia emeryi]|uniref:transmembrane protease serine 9-like n=1 Tax=Vollenhovia emeryi TaxID=411798 RepID=UPI0005F515EB|nr:PREDICTED: transmembrane protease serine 9-like [Vollenhovia emeryi]XP_011867327.1 PREDICTED: transmembrane protease serine 9-like [Vollenhovia emeryi]
MAKIFILIPLLLQLCTIIQGYPCSEYYTHTFEPETNKPMGQIEIPSPPKNGPYDLKIGFNTNPSIHKKSFVQLDTAQPLGDALEGVKQGGSLLYHIHFKTETIPTLTKLWFNDRQLCPIPGETEQVATTITISKRISVSGPISPEEEPSSLNGQSHNNRSINNNQGWTLANPDNNQCGRSNTHLLIAYGLQTIPGQWPWVVAIFVEKENREFLCTGSIVTNRHVITAAHCIQLNLINLSPNELLIVLGRFNLNQWNEAGSVNRTVSSYMIHPDYMRSLSRLSSDSDLAIVTLKTPVEFSPLIRPICLWSQSIDLQNVVNQIGYVVGWGKDESANYLENPRMVTASIVSHTTCHWSNHYFALLTSNRTFCAGFRNSSGPCKGDSGSGLVLFNNITGRYYLRGLVSQAFGDLISPCDLQQYVVYVDVAQYVPWIVQQISTTELPSQPETTATPLPVPTLNTKRPSHSTIATPIFERPHYNEIDCGRPTFLPYLLDKGGMSSHPAQWPWLAAIFVPSANPQYRCPGSLLTTRHVIIAAHCLMWNVRTNDTVPAILLEVSLGRVIIQRHEGGSVYRRIYSYTIHPDYAHTVTGDSDLAILTLAEPVEFSPYIKPVCLWHGSDTLQNVIDKLGFDVGWRKNGYGYPFLSRTVEMRIVRQETCRRSHEHFIDLISERTFCAVDQDLEGPCYAYSGSALMIYDNKTNRFMLRGIVSRTLPSEDDYVSCDQENYVVYVDVAQYVSWIEQQISTTEPPSQPETTATPLPVPTLNTKRPLFSNITTPTYEIDIPYYNDTDQCGRMGYVNQLVTRGESTNPAEWPWLVALFVLRPNLKYQCAGTVLTTRHVITAANCMKWNDTTNDTIPANLLEVALGRFNLRQWREEGSVNREIYNYTIHPDYAYTISGDSDLAILTLVEPVEFSPFIKPVCLWTGSDTLQNVIHKLGFVVGWEKDEDGNYSGTPRMEKMSIVNQEECLWLTLEVFFNLTTSRTFCAGARERRGLYGYSGSALTIFDDNVNRFQLRGIFSTAWYFPYSSVPYDVIHVVYVDVAKYKTWIEEQISTT